jgi:hypothetical protein
MCCLTHQAIVLQDIYSLEGCRLVGWTLGCHDLDWHPVAARY